MPHIHTNPNQHDVTVSAYIIRKVNDEWYCLVHYHKKFDKLLQIGGHLELDETPWQSLVHEVREEAGYSMSELQLLQPTADTPHPEKPIVHPVPFASNTHYVGSGHYHSDLAYAFIASDLPNASVAKGESADLRWETVVGLQHEVKAGKANADTTAIYEFLLQIVNTYVCVPAINFSLLKPSEAEVEYKRGAASEQRKE